MIFPLERYNNNFNDGCFLLCFLSFAFALTLLRRTTKRPETKVVLGLFDGKSPWFLLSDAETLNHIDITLWGGSFQKVKQPPPPTHHHQQTTTTGMVFTVRPEMLCKSTDFFRQNGNLNFGGATVFLRIFVLADNRLFFFFLKRHSIFRNPLVEHNLKAKS